MLYWKLLTYDEAKRIGFIIDYLSNPKSTIYIGYLWPQSKVYRDMGDGPWHFLGLILNETLDRITIKGCTTEDEAIRWLKTVQQDLFDLSDPYLHLNKDAAFELLDLLNLAATNTKEVELSSSETFELLTSDLLPDPLRIENLKIKPEQGYQEIYYQYQSNPKYDDWVTLIRFTNDFHSTAKRMFLNILQIDRQAWENQTFTRTSLYDSSRLQITLSKKGLSQLCRIMDDVLSSWSSEF